MGNKYGREGEKERRKGAVKTNIVLKVNVITKGVYETSDIVF